MARAMGRDFSGALSVDFHPMHVATNTILSRSIIDSIINLVLTVSSYSCVARSLYFHVVQLSLTVHASRAGPL